MAAGYESGIYPFSRAVFQNKEVNSGKAKSSEVFKSKIKNN